MMPRGQNLFYIGVDLGKKQDYSTMTIIEAIIQYGPDAQTNRYKYNLRFEVSELLRFPLGTPYLKVVEHVAGVMKDEQLNKPCLVMDSSGVGEPIKELFQGMGLEPVCVNFVGGSTVRDLGQLCYNVPRDDILGALQIVFEAHTIKFADGLEHYTTILGELAHLDDGRKPSPGTEEIAWREKSHDDLVFAVAVVLWFYPRDYRVMYLTPDGRRQMGIAETSEERVLREKDEKRILDYDPLGRK